MSEGSDSSELKHYILGSTRFPVLDSCPFLQNWLSLAR